MVKVQCPPKQARGFPVFAPTVGDFLPQVTDRLFFSPIPFPSHQLSLLNTTPFFVNQISNCSPVTGVTKSMTRPAFFPFFYFPQTLPGLTFKTLSLPTTVPLPFIFLRHPLFEDFNPPPPTPSHSSLPFKKPQVCQYLFFPTPIVQFPLYILASPPPTPPSLSQWNEVLKFHFPNPDRDATVCANWFSPTFPTPFPL